MPEWIDASVYLCPACQHHLTVTMRTTQDPDDHFWIQSIVIALVRHHVELGPKLGRIAARLEPIHFNISDAIHKTVLDYQAKEAARIQVEQDILLGDRLEDLFDRET